MRARFIALTLLVAAVCLLVGCPAAGVAGLNSGIAGIVQAGPQCPVIGPNSPPNCQDQPLAAAIIVRSAATSLEVTRFESAADGTFRIPLPPGAYILDPQPGSPTGFPHAAPLNVQVQAGEFTDVTIDYDTGIR